MQIPFRTAADELEYLEPGRSPLIPFSCLLVIAVAVAVVGFELSGRLALITAGFTAVGLATRLPRILGGLAAATLLLAAFAVLEGGQSAPALATAAHHALAAATHGAGK